MINAIQHIGIGVRSRDKTLYFYDRALGFAVPISRHSGSCRGVVPIIGKDETRDVAISVNPYGGALVEVFQYTSKAPALAQGGVDFSCNGYLFYGLKAKNIEKALGVVAAFGGEKITGSGDFTPLQKSGWKTAMFKDVEGNCGILLEYPGSNIGYGDGRPRIGGIEYVAVGVSDIKRSIDFYTHVLGYDNIVYRYEGHAPEWEAVFGKKRFMKRALLARSEKSQSIFRHFLKGGMIELIEVEGNKKKHIFDGRKWGDIGLMELCFDVSDINGTLEELLKRGVVIAVPPYAQDMGMNTRATFAYIRDPDGSLLEFADISSLPVPYFLIRLFLNPFMVEAARKFRLLKSGSGN